MAQCTKAEHISLKLGDILLQTRASQLERGGRSRGAIARAVLAQSVAEGGGVLLDLFTHHADLARWFFDAEVESVRPPGAAGRLVPWASAGAARPASVASTRAEASVERRPVVWCVFMARELSDEQAPMVAHPNA